MHAASDPIPPDADVAAPDSPEAAIDLVRTCMADCTPLIDYGDFHTGLGHPPASAGGGSRRYRYRGRGIECFERDFVVRIGAGATMADIRTALHAHGQFLPLDGDDELMLGELVLHNVWGPMRIGFGAARDLLLGVRFIDGEGGDVRAGGRTVKNVAGYDLSRFIIGSLGEMGLLCELTLRTSPEPAHVRMLEIGLPAAASVDGLVPELLATDAAPAAMALERGEDNWRLKLTYFGEEGETQHQASGLEKWLGQRGLSDLTAGLVRREGGFDDYRQRAAASLAWQRGATTLLKLIVPPAVTGQTVDELYRRVEGPGLHWLAYPAHGAIWVGGSANGEQVHALEAHGSGAVIAAAGMKAWYHRPEYARQMPPFAPPQPDWPLLARIKHALDPHHLFNPGRMLTLKEGGDG